MKYSSCVLRKSIGIQRGVAAVEFALVALLFFMLLLGVIEFGRVIFLWNAVQEVTRRAARDATVANFSDADAMDKVRWNAIFRSTAGPLALGGEINDTYVRIDYLNFNLGPVNKDLTCPSQNISTCLSNPNSASCIRFVRAQLCDPSNQGACDAVPYTAMVPLLSPFFAGVTIPRSQVVMPAESLGYRPSQPGCLPPP
jgi:hypothetical protein